MAKKRGAARNPLPSVMVGIGWYRENQWRRLLDNAADVEKLESTHAEWHKSASLRFREMYADGINVCKIDVDIKELLAWCRKENRPNDGPARAAFIARKVHEMYGDTE